MTSASAGPIAMTLAQRQRIWWQKESNARPPVKKLHDPCTELWLLPPMQTKLTCQDFQLCDMLHSISYYGLFDFTFEVDGHQ